MFDTVARASDAPSEREILSFALAFLSTGLALGLIWKMGVHAIVEAVAPAEPQVMVEFLGLPPPPAPATAHKAAATHSATPEAPQAPHPTEPTEAVDPPPTPSGGEVSDSSAATVADAGGGEGEGEGEGSSEGPGPGSGPVEVSASAIKVKRRVDPVFPETARQLGISDAHCRVRLTVNARGEPTAVDIVSCASAFQPSALDAAWKWRFYPLRVAGVAQPATFVLGIHYQLR